MPGPNNIVADTENFAAGSWVQADGATVTVNTLAAPAFAGGLAGMADTLHDADGAQQCNVYNAGFSPVGGDTTSTWIASVYIKKEPAAGRYVELTLEIRENGTPIAVGISIDTTAISGSAVAANSGGPSGGTSDFGLIDVGDGVWWRAWIRQANNNTGVAYIRASVFPARTGTLGGAADSTKTGDCTIWGLNITPGSTLLTYEPDPPYAASTIPLFTQLGAQIVRGR